MTKPAAVVLSVGLLAMSAGCAREQVRVLHPGATPTVGHPEVRPAPTRTIVKNTHVYRAGHAADVVAQAGVALRLTVSRPSTSHTRLSASYGYPPQHGHYVTFRITVVDTGSRPVAVDPRDFVVRVAGQGRVTSYDGNAPYSGAPRQLTATELDPGDRVSAPLTYDLSRVHGRLAFVPDRTAAVAWRF